MTEYEQELLEDLCRQSHPNIDGGRPCKRELGHEHNRQLADRERHMTVNGFWWV